MKNGTQHRVGFAYWSMGDPGQTERIGAGYTAKTSRDDGIDRIQAHYSLVYVVHGRGWFTNVLGRTFELRAGSFIQRYPDRPHTLILDPDSGWREAYIALGRKFFTVLRDMRLLTDENQVGRIGVRSGIVDRICDLRDALHECTELQFRALALRAIRIVCDILEATMEAAGSTPSEDDLLVERACLLLADDLAERIDLRTLCRDHGWGYERFRKLFTHKTGLPPHQYRIRRRLDAACRMLTAGDASVTEIADALGYASAQDLSAQFKKYIGVPPTRFHQ